MYLALVCSTELTNALLLPVACRAVRSIEQRLMSESAASERRLEEKFLSTRSTDPSVRSHW